MGSGETTVNSTHHLRRGSFGQLSSTRVELTLTRGSEAQQGFEFAVTRLELLNAGLPYPTGYRGTTVYFTPGWVSPGGGATIR
jgi:hypothetical protein